tara:strand:+ start:317 stop:487 length:171 start_codon:yes stop_codon:yes gene_type:complete
MITEKRKLELKAERDLTKILYVTRDNEKLNEEIRKIFDLCFGLTKEEIQNVIDHYL